MTKLNEFFLKNIDVPQLELDKLSQSIHKTFIEHDNSIQASNCRTECSASIGSDGKSVITCKLVCDL